MNMNIWEQRPDEPAEAFSLFEKFLKVATKPRNLKEVAALTGKSYDVIKKRSSKYDWTKRAVAYDAVAPANEDFVTAALVLGHAIKPVENEISAVKDENYNPPADEVEVKDTPAPALENDAATDTGNTSLFPVFDAPPSLNQRVIKIQFYLRQTAQNIIEIGKELTAAKQEVPHGQWLNWLDSNFGMTERTAQNFMKVAERLSNTQLISHFNSTQLITMLALPAGEEEKFIAEKAAEGKPVEDMTVKNLREEIKCYKEKIASLEQAGNAAFNLADKEKVRADKLQHQLSLFVEEKNSARAALDAAKKTIAQKDAEIQSLANKPPVTVEIEKPVIPADYEKNKKALEESNARILSLQAQLDAATSTPAETESLKAEIAKLQASQAEQMERAAVFSGMDTICNILANLQTSKRFIKEYAAENPTKFSAVRDTLFLD